MTSEANRRLIEEAYTYFFAGDVDGMGRYLSEDAEVVEAASLPYGGSYRGPEGLKRLIAQLTECWDDLAFDIKQIAANDVLVAAYGTFTATARASQQKVSFPLVEIWHIENGKIVRCEPIYGDTVLACAALAGTKVAA